MARVKLLYGEKLQEIKDAYVKLIMSDLTARNFSEIDFINGCI